MARTPITAIFPPSLPVLRRQTTAGVGCFSSATAQVRGGRRRLSVGFHLDPPAVYRLKQVLTPGRRWSSEAAVCRLRRPARAAWGTASPAASSTLPVGPTGPEEFAPPDVARVTDLVHGLRDLRRIMPAHAEPDSGPSRLQRPSRPSGPSSSRRSSRARSSQPCAAACTSPRQAQRGAAAQAAACGGPRPHQPALGAPLRPGEAASSRRQDDFPNVRVVDVPEPIAPLSLSGPIRMLVAISSPMDLPHLDVEGSGSGSRRRSRP